MIFKTVPKEQKNAIITVIFKKERLKRPCQLQSFQATLTYLQIIHKNSKE